MPRTISHPLAQCLIVRIILFLALMFGCVFINPYAQWFLAFGCGFIIPCKAIHFTSSSRIDYNYLRFTTAFARSIFYSNRKITLIFLPIPTFKTKRGLEIFHFDILTCPTCIISPIHKLRDINFDKYTFTGSYLLFYGLNIFCKGRLVCDVIYCSGNTSGKDSLITKFINNRIGFTVRILPTNTSALVTTLLDPIICTMISVVFYRYPSEL